MYLGYSPPTYPVGGHHAGSLSGVVMGPGANELMGLILRGIFLALNGGRLVLAM
jgi:hypothetical protein